MNRHGNTNTVPICSYIDSRRFLNFPGSDYIALAVLSVFNINLVENEGYLKYLKF